MENTYLVRVKTSVSLPEELLTPRDTEIIKRSADRLNREAEDAMEYQHIWRDA
jgi:hypothetical protein